MIKRKGQTVVGDYPTASNYIDDTQARSDRMYSSSKVDSNLNYLKYKDIEENSKTIQELYNEQGTGARCYYSKFTDSPKANDQGYLTIVKNTMNYGSVTFMSNNAYWVRNLNGGTWSEWYKLVTESDIGSYTRQVSNARLIGVSDENAESNKPCTVISGASGIPSNFSHGARTVKWVSSNEIYVELIGVDTSGNLHKYISGYINKVWKDWKEL